MWESRWFQRFWGIVGAASVRVKVLGIVLGVIVLLGLFVMVQMRQALYGTLEAALQVQGIDLAQFVGGRVDDARLCCDADMVTDVLEGLQEHYSGNGHNTLVDYMFVTDENGDLIAASDADALTPEAIRPTVPFSEPQVRHLKTAQGDVIDITMPLPQSGGEFRIGLAEDNIEQIVLVVTTQIISLTLVMVAVGFVAAFFLTWILTRPLLSLLDATRTVAKGDFSVQVPRWANDEIGDLSEAFNAMTRSLAQAERERAERENLRASYIRRVITAQEDERKRIARELHDSTSQSLTSLLVGLRHLEEATDPATAKARLAEIRKTVNGTLDEVHALAWQLRPSVLDDLGLAAALQRYIGDYQTRYAIQVDFVFRNLAERLPIEIETTLYRVIQEGLTNIARHAQAQNASILLEQRAASVRVILEDNGVGFDAETVTYSQKSLGLQGMRERVALLNGKLVIESQPGQGTSLFIEIPLTEAKETSA